MMQYDGNKSDILRKMIELVLQPGSLLTSNLAERAVERKNQDIGGSQRIIATLFQIGKSREIILQRRLFVPLEVVVAQSRIYVDLVFSPALRLLVPDLPVLGMISAVCNIATYTHKRRMRIGN